MKVETEPQFDDGPKVRILFCDECHTVDEIPDFDGPPEYDMLLQYRVADHQFDSGRMHPLQLGRVGQATWSKRAAREQIMQKFAIEQGHVPPGQGAGLGATFYALKANFMQDAMVCWKQHLRTTDCDDYRSDAKLLLADTKAERKEAGLDTSVAARPKHWLCDYCPVQSIVDQRKRAADGLYDN